MITNDSLRSRRSSFEDYSVSTMEMVDVEMVVSFEDFSERLMEDVEMDKRSRKHQGRSAWTCAMTFVGICALLYVAASKTLTAAESSVNARSNVPPVQRYQSIHAAPATRRN